VVRRRGIHRRYPNELSLEVVAMIKEQVESQPKLKEFVERIHERPATNARSSVEANENFSEPIKAQLFNRH